MAPRAYLEGKAGPPDILSFPKGPKQKKETPNGVPKNKSVSTIQEFFMIVKRLSSFIFIFVNLLVVVLIDKPDDLLKASIILHLGYAKDCSRLTPV